MEELLAESKRLKAQIDEYAKAATQLDPDGTPSADALIARTRLDKLNDDYRQILTAIATGQRTTTANRAQSVSAGQYGTYVYDPDGNLVQSIPPNADEETTKAVNRQNAEMLRNERTRNATAGKGYVTDAELQKLQLDARAQGLNESEFQEKIRQFDATQRQKDKELAITQAKTTADIAYTGSQTGLTNARIAELASKTPAEIAEMQARGDLSTAQAAEVRQRMAKPTVLTQGVEGPSIYTQGPTGDVTTTMRPGYVPKTLADIQARTGQILAAANAKKAELIGKVGPNYSQDQALGDFNRWYDQTVTPELGTLQAATEEAQFARGKEVAAQQTAAYSAASAAGRNMVDAWKEQQSRALGPGAAGMIGGSLNAINKAAGLPSQDYSALVTQGPRLTDQVSQEVDRVLANISPSAAARAGAPQPNYAGVNPADVLSRNQFQFPGGPGAPVPAAAGPVAAQLQANSPFGAIGSNPMLAAQQARNRMLASQQTAAASANPANSPFGAIGANPMLGAQNMPPPPAPAPPPAVSPAVGPRPSVYRPVIQQAPMPYLGGTVPPAGVEMPTMPNVPYSDAAARIASGLGGGGLGPESGMPYGQVGEPSVNGLGTLGQSQTGILPESFPTTPMGGTVPPAGVEVPTTPGMAALRQQVTAPVYGAGFNPFGFWNQVGSNPQTQQELQRILGTTNYQWP